MKSAAAENDRRAREDLLSAYEAVAVRITAHVKEQQELAGKHAAGTYRTIALPFLRVAAIELRRSVDRLNSLIDVKGPPDEIQWSEMIEALNNVRGRAVELQDAIARELGPRGGSRDSFAG
jgi:hypothetical protein